MASMGSVDLSITITAAVPRPDCVPVGVRVWIQVGMG